MTQTGFSSRAESITQFLTVFLVFLLVVALTYFTTRFVGKFQKTVNYNKNFNVIETYRITNGKYLQIVRIGEKYVVIGISKDNITKICDLAEEDIVLMDERPQTGDSFMTLISKARDCINKGGNQNEK